MNLDNIWFYILVTTLGAAFLRIGITGQVRSIGRGSARGVTATVKSIALRIGLALFGAVLLIWLILKAFGRV